MNTIPPYLTPSELVYLNGEKFAQKAGVFNKTRLVHLDLDVSAAPLAQAVLAAAFLTMEQQGTLRLEVRQKKVMLGLATSKALFADSVGPAAAWPQNTIESFLPGLAYQLAANKNKNDVETMVYAWLGQDSGLPFEEVFSRVKYALAARGLLETRQETRLKIFKSTVYTCPDTTRQLAAAQPVQAIEQIFGWCQQTRPELWKMLNDSVNKGISLRKEQTDQDFNND
jgi:hypothetical protein